MCGSKLFLKVMKTAEIIRFLLITNQLLYRLSYISIFTFGVADLILTNQLLYRLSYISIFTFGVADLILTNQLLYVSIGNDEII